MRPELELISEWIPPNSRVLDLGCGDGALLAYLHEHRHVSGYGLEIDTTNIIKCIQAGVNVIHADLEAGLDDFGEHSFDYVLMTQTLQVVKHTEKLLDEMLRVGRQGIVTFPNFGFWRCRMQMALQGMMPVVKALPHEWYNTPNVHLFTINDFEVLCHRKHITILQRMVLNHAHQSAPGACIWPNVLGEIALYRLSHT
ncbi:MAG: methionine biosynthesis protein MetW [Candidatus Contendobacter odensis]|uniref:Methionine biosynthesis protein MetW n=1 Tax=Candidatus Contendibacter odensensis TaxID=1400860 RepID=A0A2G6PFT3_9GAMM|nr:MAG: methionine biosynthesis protein MetW [Candidatus Contendobacter odensis]